MRNVVPDYDDSQRAVCVSPTPHSPCRLCLTEAQTRHPATFASTRSLTGCLAKEEDRIHALAFSAKCTTVSSRLLAKNDIIDGPRVVKPPHQHDDRTTTTHRLSLNNDWSVYSTEEKPLTTDILQTLEILRRQHGTPWSLSTLAALVSALLAVSQTTSKPSSIRRLQDHTLHLH